MAYQFLQHNMIVEKIVSFEQFVDRYFNATEFNAELNYVLNGRDSVREAVSFEQFVDRCFNAIDFSAKLDFVLNRKDLDGAKLLVKIKPRSRLVLDETYDDATVDAFCSGPVDQVPRVAGVNHTLHFSPDLKDKVYGLEVGYHNVIDSTSSIEEEGQDFVSVAMKDIPHCKLTDSVGMHTFKTYIFFPELYVRNRRSGIENSGNLPFSIFELFMDAKFIPALTSALSPPVRNRLANSVSAGLSKGLGSQAVSIFYKDLNQGLKALKEVLDLEKESVFRNFFLVSVSWGGKIPLEFYRKQVGKVRRGFVDVGFNMSFASSVPSVAFANLSHVSDRFLLPVIGPYVETRKMDTYPQALSSSFGNFGSTVDYITILRKKINRLYFQTVHIIPKNYPICAQTLHNIPKNHHDCPQSVHIRKS